MPGAPRQVNPLLGASTRGRHDNQQITSEDPEMKLILFGATGMVGAGTLTEALADSEVEAVLSVGRKSCGVAHPKLRELLLPDLFEFAAIEPELAGYDGCAWALGISSLGMSEAAYAKVTEELTLLWARALLRLNPAFSFCYCSAAGAGGPTMWAGVRRRIEGALKALPFRHSGCVRPAAIEPGPGVTSRFISYRAVLFLARPLFPFLLRTFPSVVTTSGRLGRAMLRVVQGRTDRYILESADINRIDDARP